MRTVVFTNIYNEEFLAPFWFAHHSKLFDHGVIIDYGCTDATLDIARAFCPTWEIRKTRNQFFDYQPIDREFMDIEAEFPGCIKTVLNTTEFIFPSKPLREYFNGTPMCLSLKPLTPVTHISQASFDPKNLSEMFAIDKVNSSVDIRQGWRHIHTHRDGAYHGGRHDTYHHKTFTDDITLLWLGYWPWNARTLQRKLQIKNNIGRDRGTSASIQHFWTEERMNQEQVLAASNVAELPPSVKHRVTEMCLQHDAASKDTWDAVVKRYH